MLVELALVEQRYQAVLERPRREDVPQPVGEETLEDRVRVGRRTRTHGKPSADPGTAATSAVVPARHLQRAR